MPRKYTRVYIKKHPCVHHFPYIYYRYIRWSYYGSTERRRHRSSVQFIQIRKLALIPQLWRPVRPNPRFPAFPACSFLSRFPPFLFQPRSFRHLPPDTRSLPALPTPPLRSLPSHTRSRLPRTRPFPLLFLSSPLLSHPRKTCSFPSAFAHGPVSPFSYILSFYSICFVLFFSPASNTY